jgi:hypothetical protein
VQLVLIVVEFELEQSVLLLVGCFHPGLAYESFVIAVESTESKNKERPIKNDVQKIKY